jgi:uncharacterized membrane protein (DUF373 family)
MLSKGKMIMQKIVSIFEKGIIYFLIFLMAIVVVASVAELAWIIFRNVITEPYIFIDISNLLEIFSFFLLVLIGVELLETIKMYSSDHNIRVEVVILVGIIAVARKIITIDYKNVDGFILVGIGIVLAALTGAYYLIKKIRCG